MNDDDDTPSFYMLWKFSPGSFFQEPGRRGNLFSTAPYDSKSFYKFVGSTDYSEEGFHNTLFAAKSLVDPNLSKAMWSVKTNETPGSKDDTKPSNNIWNCDSDYTKDEMAGKTFVHQVYFKTFAPNLQD